MRFAKFVLFSVQLLLTPVKLPSPGTSSTMWDTTPTLSYQEPVHLDVVTALLMPPTRVPWPLLEDVIGPRAGTLATTEAPPGIHTNLAMPSNCRTGTVAHLLCGSLTSCFSRRRWEATSHFLFANPMTPVCSCHCAKVFALPFLASVSKSVNYFFAWVMLNLSPDLTLPIKPSQRT